MSSQIGFGEYLLLKSSPIFKRRYAADGDVVLGCTIGCSFCYYRMIDATAPFIGTGALKRLATPEEFAQVVADSKLISERSLVIMGARGDASMYPDEVPKVLEAARKLGAERELINAAAKMVEAVKVELELEKTGRPPTLADWLKAAEREAAFREFAYSLVGLNREAGYVEGLAAQIKDDLWGAAKGGREDTETRLNRPLIQRTCTRPEDALKALKTARSRQEAVEILTTHCP